MLQGCLMANAICQTLRVTVSSVCFPKSAFSMNANRHQYGSYKKDYTLISTAEQKLRIWVLKGTLIMVHGSIWNKLHQYTTTVHCILKLYY